MKSPIANMDDFAALKLFFRLIEQGLQGLVEPGHFFDLMAENVITEYVITVPGYPPRIEGRLLGRCCRQARGLPQFTPASRSLDYANSHRLAIPDGELKYIKAKFSRPTRSSLQRMT